MYADETVLNCLDEKDNKTHYMWLYATGERAERRIFLYDYQKSRANKHARRFYTDALKVLLKRCSRKNI